MLNRIGQQLGNYRLISCLAQSGFAEVYLGEHIYLGTNAAIKILHAELTPEDLKQFRAEARSIARLRHPHIVSIFDFDVHDDVPFLVMEYVPGGTLRQRHPKGTRIPPATILPYLRQAASALQYAHDERLIHRDVKPENMLVGRHQEVLLSDFAIAVVASATTRDLVGTPTYMAPEQLEGKPLPASDQYALGSVVYEWLCGTPPLGEISARHLNVASPSLCEQVPDLLPKFEQVVQKALAKDPRERYATILEFADAFEKEIPARTESAPQAALRGTTTPSEPALNPQSLYLDATVPVSAAEAKQAPAAPTQPARKTPHLTSRRTLLLGLAGLVTAATVGNSIIQWARSSYPAKATTKPPVPTPMPTAIPVGTTLRTYYGHFGYVYTVAWSPDQTKIASGSDDHTVHIWDANTGADVLPTYSNHGDGVHTLAWSHDGSLIASGSADKTVQVWKATDESSVYTYSNHAFGVNAVAWSPDSTLIASASIDKTVQVWKATDGSGALTYSNHTGTVNAVAWSPDGSLIASASHDKTAQVWKSADGTNILTYSGHSSAVNAVAWSPDGTLIASASSDNTVHIWKSADGTHLFTYSGHSDNVNAVAWSPDGALIASASNDKTAQVWQAR